MDKYVLIVGGCGRRGQKQTKRLLEEGYTVVLVDNLVNGVHPKDWEAVNNCWEHPRLVLYCEDAVSVLLGNDPTWQHVFAKVKWDMVMQYAKIHDKDIVIESSTNHIIDGCFFRWTRNLESKPCVISTLYTPLAQQMILHLDTLH